MRAVVDIGSNSLLLLVGRRGEDGAVEVVEDRSTVTRLSRGVDVHKTLSTASVEKSLRVLEGYRERIDALGATLVAVAATEGVRMAEDANGFLKRVEAVMGSPVRVLSGEEEAELSFRSVSMEQPSTALHVIDVGGASTEIAWGQGGKVHARHSLPIGSVRLTERFLASDPPTSPQIALVRAAATEQFAGLRLPSSGELIGLAGTVTTAAALLLGLERYDREAVDGTTFSLDQILGLASELATETVALREQRSCLTSGRADVIVAGLYILAAAMEALGATTLRCRDRGHRFALL
jgi:exopolyphosphatase / guanosine-5'-triphosphate,3'-diphosphate pyrophosphatase